MIVCHCNRIGHRQIACASADLLQASPRARLTVAAVYDALGVKPRCGRCLRLAAQLIPGPDGDKDDVPRQPAAP